MRLAVLADIHGNLPALEAVLADVQQHDVDHIVVAGDLVAGPQPVEAIRSLRSLGSWMIRGNTDDNLLRYDAGDAPDGWRVSKQWAVMRWSHLHLDRETLDFIASLPEQRVIVLEETAPIRVVHGSPRNPSESLFPDRDSAKLSLFRRAGLLPPDCDPARLLDLAFAQIDEPVLVCGHTHIPWTQEQDRRLVLNPGSVGAPLNGDVRAQYALLTWWDNHWQVDHQAVPYDLDRIRTAFRESGLLTEGGGLAQAFLLSIETGQNVGEYFLSHAYGLAAEAGFEDCDIVPDDVWERAVATFDWDRAASSTV